MENLPENTESNAKHQGKTCRKNCRYNYYVHNPSITGLADNVKKYF
jgi:hypothetical protein